MTTADDLVRQWRAMGPAAWAESRHGWLTDAGTPIALTPWQEAVLARWWALRAAVRVLAISNVKKSGKTLLNGLALAWRWLAMPGTHFAVGNDQDQSAGRQFAEVAKMVRRHPYLRTVCKVEKLRIEFKPTGSEIVALAVDAAGNSGANHLTASHTETWGVTLEAGIRAYEETAPPPGEFYGLPALRICDSYAGYIDQSNVWHDLVDSGLAGELVDDAWPIYFDADAGVMLFHATGADARERCFRGTPAQAARYYASERRTLRPMAWQRFHENERTSGAEQFISEADWRGIEDATLAPIGPTRETPLFVGLDLGTKSDFAAAVGVMPNGPDRARIAMHQIWKPSPGRPVSLADVRAWLLRTNADFWLSGVYFDPSQAALLAEDLRGAGLRMVEVPQSLPELGPRGLRLWESIRDGKLSTYPNDDLRAAATAAVAAEVAQGLHLKKGAGGRKVDPLVALSFALPAALGASGAPKPGAVAAANPAVPSRVVRGPIAGAPPGWGSSRFGRGDRSRGWHR